jgi:hypothetical protein
MNDMDREEGPRAIGKLWSEVIPFFGYGIAFYHTIPHGVFSLVPAP